MVTIKNIAEKVKLSQSTVSIVLRGEGDNRKISKQTQNFIWDTAKEMGYQVNISARNLKTKDTTLYISVYWTIDSRSYYMMDFFAGLLKGAQKYEQKIEFIIKPYEDLTKSFDTGGPYQGAIVCNATDMQVQYLESIQCLFPIVIYNRETKRFDSVCVNDERVGEMAAEILAGIGTRSAMLLTPKAIYAGMRTLRESFLGHMAAAGIPVSVAEISGSLAGGNADVRKYLEKSREVDAVFCMAANMAQSFMNLLVRNGVKIPEQCRILTVSSGNREQEECAVVPLSVIETQRQLLAEKCLDRVMERLKNGNMIPVSETAEPVYLRRVSC